MTLDQSLEDRRHAVDASDDHDDFLTATIADQLIGVPVLTVQDVLGFRTVAPIPMAPPEVAGSINLRGRIVTVVDLRARLGLPPRPDDMSSMNFVVDHEGELYSLMVDTVGEVLSVTSDRFEANPADDRPSMARLRQGGLPARRSTHGRPLRGPPVGHRRVRTGRQRNRNWAMNDDAVFAGADVERRRNPWPLTRT